MTASGDVPLVHISDLPAHAGRIVRLRGWVYNRRSSGKIEFIILRDGTGFVQVVVVASDVPDDVFRVAASLGQESAVVLTGEVRTDRRAPGGYEVSARSLELLAPSEDYPISLKEHGVEFLMDNRHLWFRTPRQTAILKLRAELIRALRDFFDDRGFVLVDSPILTPAACEGTTTLFKTDYFGDPAYLSQSGQLYQEAAAMALGRTYCFGPTFRAEKSKTRRHLIEFWMVEPEMAFVEFEENLRIQEEMVSFVVQRILERRLPELETVGRDTAPLRKVRPPFPRLSYDEAVELVRSKGLDMEWGDDFGAPQETAVASEFDRPVFVHRYPTAVKAFYMKPDPDRPEVCLSADLLAPEGYGEIIGGGQRIDDIELLKRRLAEHCLPEETYRWYLDLRRYGSVPHSGFGLGVERTLAWIAGLEHVRETIPFPRMLHRLYP